MTVRAHVGGITFDGTGDGMFMIVDDGLKGWLDGGVSMRRESIDRARGHGAHRAPGFLSPRFITIDGELYTSSRAEQDRQMARLSAMLADGSDSMISVSNEIGALFARVARADPPKMSRDAMGVLSRFQVHLVAADPRVYGVRNSFDAAPTATVFHRGTFPAHPVVEVSSAPASWSVTSPRGTFTVTGAGAGGVHRVDLRTGRVTRDGVWMQGVGRGPLWAVPPGATWLHSMSVDGRVLIRDTYM